MNAINEAGFYEYAVETEDLRRSFGKFEAVRGVSLRVPRGTVFGLLGVNGAGKSTIIKMIVGHLRPTAGRIRVLGHDASADPVETRRRVAYVSENRYLYEWMTVEESVRFTRAFHENWDDRKAADLLRRFSLPPDKKVRQLSRGNRARLCLLLALSFNPELIILDEPTSGLDPIGAGDFDDLISTLQRTLGLTVFMVTHDLDSIHTVCDRVAALGDGHIIAAGTIDTMMASDHPWLRSYFNGKRARAVLQPGA